MKLGDRGEEVRKYQKILGLVPDGAFGNKTKNAVINFQRSNGLNATGVIDQQTRNMLDTKASAFPFDGKKNQKIGFKTMGQTTPQEKSTNKQQKNEPIVNNNYKSKVSKQVVKQIDYLKSINFKDAFTVLDDANNVVHAFNPGFVLYKSFKVNTGKDPGDFFDNDDAVSYAWNNMQQIGKEYMSNNKSLSDTITGAFYAAKKNLVRNTPSGIFRRVGLLNDWFNNKIQTYFAEKAVGKRWIQFETLSGSNISFGFHGTKDPDRLEALNTKGKPRNLTYGCVNFNDKDILEINNFIKYGQYSFWLSDVDLNKIEMFPNK